MFIPELFINNLLTLIKIDRWHGKVKRIADGTLIIRSRKASPRFFHQFQEWSMRPFDLTNPE